MPCIWQQSCPSEGSTKPDSAVACSLMPDISLIQKCPLLHFFPLGSVPKQIMTPSLTGGKHFLVNQLNQENRQPNRYANGKTPVGGHETHSSYTQAGFHHQSAHLHNLMLSLQPNVDSLSAGLITTKETGLTYHEWQNHLLNPALSPLRLATASVTFHLPVFTFLDLDNNRKFMFSCWAFPICRVSSLL